MGGCCFGVRYPLGEVARREGVPASFVEPDELGLTGACALWASELAGVSVGGDGW